MSISDQEQDILFRQVELAELEVERAAYARSIIHDLPESDVLSSARDAGVAENILATLRFGVPTILAEDIEKPAVFTEYAMSRHEATGEPIKVQRLLAKLSVPFVGNSAAFQVRPPSQHHSTVLRATVEAGCLTHVISLDHKNVDQSGIELNAFLHELKRTLETLRSDFQAAETRLRDKITQELYERR